MKIFVNRAGDQVAVLFADQGPYLVLHPDAQITERFVPDGREVWDSNHNRDDDLNEAYQQGLAEGIRDERKAAKKRKTNPDWLRIVTEHLEEKERADELDELLAKLAAADQTRKGEAAR